MNLYKLFQNVHANPFGLYNIILIILKTYQFIIITLTKPVKQRNNNIFSKIDYFIKKI